MSTTRSRRTSRTRPADPATTRSPARAATTTWSAAPATTVIAGGAGDDDLDGVTAPIRSTAGTARTPPTTHGLARHRPPRHRRADLSRHGHLLRQGGLRTDKLKGFEDLLGSDYADKLTGNGGANTLDGGLRDDDHRRRRRRRRRARRPGRRHRRGRQRAPTTLDGGDGFDSLNGGAGADELNGGADDDSLSGAAGADRLSGPAAMTRSPAATATTRSRAGAGDDRETGGKGRDRFNQGQAADGGDRVDGGPGTDTVDYRGRTAKLTMTLGSGANDGAKDEGDNLLKTVEVVFAGSGADKLTAGVRGRRAARRRRRRCPDRRQGRRLPRRWRRQ